MSNPTIIRFPTQARLVNTDVTAKPLVTPMATPVPKPLPWYARLWRRLNARRRR